MCITVYQSLTVSNADKVPTKGIADFRALLQKSVPQVVAFSCFWAKEFTLNL